jgi:hypothetical protein
MPVSSMVALRGDSRGAPQDVSSSDPAGAEACRHQAVLAEDILSGESLALNLLVQVCGRLQEEKYAAGVSLAAVV